MIRAFRSPRQKFIRFWGDCAASDDKFVMLLPAQRTHLFRIEHQSSAVSAGNAENVVGSVVSSQTALVLSHLHRHQFSSLLFADVCRLLEDEMSHQQLIPTLIEKTK